MSASIGIDLGTTNSVAAYMHNGKIDYIRFRNKESIPSIMLYQDGKTIVGDKALRKSMLYPENFIKSSKTFMGDTTKSWRVEDKEFTPTDVAREILLEIKSATKKEFGDTEKIETVITVPAYFTSSQIDETKKAAEDAGYVVKRIITEPVAAALAYGFEDNLNQKIFIIDIGGGTFDTAILEVKNQQFNTLAIGGDNHLGGDNFDTVIYEMFLKHIRIDEGVNLSSFEKSDLDESDYRKAVHMLRNKAEETKIELSEQEEVNISIANLFGKYNFEMTLTRQEFESAASNILDKIRSEIKKTLSDSGIDTKKIDKVVLVGGSSRIPAIRDYVVEIFGVTPYADKPLDKLVAMGAAIAVTEENSVQIRDILSHTLGTEIIGDRFSPIIPKNTRYPVSMSETYTTVRDFQESVWVSVYEGEGENVNNNTYYGGFALDGIEKARKGVPTIKVTFSFDENRILQVSAKDLNTNASREEVIEIAKGAKKKVKTEVEAFDIALLIDVSGSMCGSPIEKAIYASKSLVTDMIDLSIHRIGVVSFGSSATKLSGLSSDMYKLSESIEQLKCYGSTDMAGGIRKARKKVLNEAQQRKMMIIVTDGYPDSKDEAYEQALKSKEKGIKIVTIGIGNGIDRELLKSIASGQNDVYEGEDFDNLSSIFQDIANSLQTTL